MQGKQMPRIRFDTTIHLGHMVTAVVFVLSAGVVFASVSDTLHDSLGRTQMMERIILQVGESNKRMADSLDAIRDDIAAIRGLVDKARDGSPEKH